MKFSVGAAGLVGMRLSTVQCYFKSRDDVLTAMVARYFEAGTMELVQLTKASEAKSPLERVPSLALPGPSHGTEISDMCRAFGKMGHFPPQLSHRSVPDGLLPEFCRADDEFCFRDAC